MIPPRQFRPSRAPSGSKSAKSKLPSPGAGMVRPAGLDLRFRRGPPLRGLPLQPGQGREREPSAFHHFLVLLPQARERLVLRLSVAAPFLLAPRAAAAAPGSGRRSCARAIFCRVELGASRATVYSPCSRSSAVLLFTYARRNSSHWTIASLHRARAASHRGHTFWIPKIFYSVPEQI